MPRATLGRSNDGPVTRRLSASLGDVRFVQSTSELRRAIAIVGDQRYRRSPAFICQSFDCLPLTLTNDSRSPAPILRFERVSRRVLAEFSFTLTRGDIVALVGPNGSGKSTVLRLAAALERPDGGTVSINGEDIGRLRASALPVLRRSLGLLPQSPPLLDDRSVLANVMLPARVAGLTTLECQSRAQAALERVGLAADAIAKRAPQQLSASERQRVALARAIVNRPSLLLLDEPTAALDRAAAAALLALLDRFAAAGVAVLLATHDTSLALPTRARRLLLALPTAAAPIP